jgi:hypothetical protein
LNNGNAVVCFGFIYFTCLLGDGSSFDPEKKRLLQKFLSSDFIEEEKKEKEKEQVVSEAVNAAVNASVNELQLEKQRV